MIRDSHERARLRHLETARLHQAAARISAGLGEAAQAERERRRAHREYAAADVQGDRARVARRIVAISATATTVDTP